MSNPYADQETSAKGENQREPTGSSLTITHRCLALRVHLDSTGFRSGGNKNAVSTSHAQKWRTKHARRNTRRVLMAKHLIAGLNLLLLIIK